MSRLAEYIAEAYEALVRNALRSILTMLGMLIGVFAVTVVYGLTAGASAGIAKTLSTSTAPNLTIQPDPQQADPTQAALNFRDAGIVALQVGDMIRSAIPYYSAFASFTAPRQYMARFKTLKERTYGFSWYGDDPNLNMIAGRKFSTADVDAAARVCIISDDLAYQFFRSDTAAIGEYLTINGTRFRIIGVPDENSGTAQNYFGGTFYVILPYTTYHNFAPGSVDGIAVWLDSSDDDAAATAAITNALHRLHGVNAKYTITSTREQLEQSMRVTNVIAVGLTAIGAISLFVAGIGIMNIMLVSVAERTREIGIRKSIGASRRDIVTQFLLEAVLLAAAGGVLGLAAAFPIMLMLGFVMARFTGPPDIPYVTVAIGGFAFSLAVGTLFGIYPALRASTMNPIEALRS